MKVRITNERFDLRDLVSSAIKANYHTRSPGGVERCIDVLNHLKSLSLSVEDIQLSGSIIKLEILRKHRNPEIRKAAQTLFYSWLKILYAQGRDNSLEAGLNKLRLKPKKPVLTISSDLALKNNERTESAVFKKKEKESLLSHKPKEIKKATTTKFSESKKKEGEKSLTRDSAETKTNLKSRNYSKRMGDACKTVTMKKTYRTVNDCINKICSDTAATGRPHRSRHSIKDKDGQITTKTLIPPPRKDYLLKIIPCRSVDQQQTEPVKESANPKSPALEEKLKNNPFVAFEGRPSKFKKAKLIGYVLRSSSR